MRCPSGARKKKNSLVECTEITAARAGDVFSADPLPSEAATSLTWPRGSKLKLSCSEAALELLSEDIPLLVLFRELLLSGVTGELDIEVCKLLSEGAAVRSSIGGLSFAAAGPAGSSPS